MVNSSSQMRDPALLASHAFTSDLSKSSIPQWNTTLRVFCEFEDSVNSYCRMALVWRIGVSSGKKVSCLVSGEIWTAKYKAKHPTKLMITSILYLYLKTKSLKGPPKNFERGSILSSSIFSAFLTVIGMADLASFSGSSPEASWLSICDVLLGDSSESESLLSRFLNSISDLFYFF